MTNKELTDFYDNIDKITSFNRIKTVYDLTNNLDIYLLRILRRDFFKYHLLKIKDLVEIHSDASINDIENVFDVLFCDDVYMHYMEDTIDLFCEVINPAFIDDFVIKTNIFFPELDELQRIGFNKAFKNQDIDEQFELNDNLTDDYYTPLIRKIIYLEKLGVIDFLRKKTPFNASVNSIANVLGSILGAKPGSIQPLLNALINDVNSTKNPMFSIKSVKAVEANLMNIGYVLKKDEN